MTPFRPDQMRARQVLPGRNQLAKPRSLQIYSTGDYDLLVKFYVDADTDIGTS